MTDEYSFKRHPITVDQRLWLTEVARAQGDFSPRAARVALRGRVAEGFSPGTIDPRLYDHRHVTPVGLWHVDSGHPLFAAVDKSMRAIRERILKTPDLKTVTAAEIAEDTGLTEREVGEALYAAGEIGTRIFSKAEGMPGNPRAYTKLYLPDDDVVDDDYLEYTSVEDLLERFYRRRGEALRLMIAHTQGSEASVVDPEQSEYNTLAALAVYEAIEGCSEREGRAHVGNVPREAERILLRAAGGTLDTADANRQVLKAIEDLAKEGMIVAAAERHRDWRIVVPMKGEGAMTTKKVFVVHGHNGESKEMVARFIEKLGLEAIILHERANKGRTIITKFQEESQGAGFAVVLMTPDDEGRAVAANSARPRARQNVVFELGFFIGKLGPERVAAMMKGDIEKPSDFDGVVYISLDAADWRVKLAQELQAAGFEFDWSKIAS